jgi:hypothetical protein
MNRIVFFNIKTVYGVETVDHLQKSDFNDYQSFKAELNRLKNEYRAAGFNIYLSQRSTKNYFN